MRLAILTDLHANREALGACLAHAERQKAEQYAFLGDLVGYGADPEWVIDTVIDYVGRGAHVLVGNHDIDLVGPDRQGMHQVARSVVDWTRSRLSETQLAFVRALPYRIELPDLLLVHANAWAPEKWEYVDGPMDATRSLYACSAHVTFCGHVHMPALYNMTLAGKTGRFTPIPDAPIPLGKTRRWLAIPGSVGQPRDGNPAACYAIFDTVSEVLTYFRVPYDTVTAAQKVLDAGLPIGLAERLLTGF
ncbi:metallophosphoesterase family protein [soil metagenome]